VHGAAIVSKLRGCRTPHKSGEVCARTPPKKKPVIRRAVKEKIRFFCSFRLFCLPILPSPPFLAQNSRSPPASPPFPNLGVDRGRRRCFASLSSIPFSIPPYLPFNRLLFFGACSFYTFHYQVRFYPLFNYSWGQAADGLFFAPL
jgi:hypothetical protein